MSVVIRQGGVYRSRNGVRWHSPQAAEAGLWWLSAKDHEPTLFWSNGKCTLSQHEPHQFDLVAEWDGAPAQQADGPDVKAEIMQEAYRIVTGARNRAYGKPERNFERIARFWTAYMQNTGRDIVITPADVSPMMRLMKEARLCETPDHRDSFVDIIGYTLTGAEVNGVAS